MAELERKDAGEDVDEAGGCSLWLGVGIPDLRPTPVKEAKFSVLPAVEDARDEDHKGRLPPGVVAAGGKPDKAMHAKKYI